MAYEDILLWYCNIVTLIDEVVILDYLVAFVDEKSGMELTDREIYNEEKMKIINMIMKCSEFNTQEIQKRRLALIERNKSIVEDEISEIVESDLLEKNKKILLDYLYYSEDVYKKLLKKLEDH